MRHANRLGDGVAGLDDGAGTKRPLRAELGLRPVRVSKAARGDARQPRVARTSVAACQSRFARRDGLSVWPQEQLLRGPLRDRCADGYHGALADLLLAAVPQVRRHDGNGVVVVPLHAL